MNDTAQTIKSNLSHNHHHHHNRTRTERENNVLYKSNRKNKVYQPFSRQSAMTKILAASIMILLSLLDVPSRAPLVGLSDVPSEAFAVAASSSSFNTQDSTGYFNEPEPLIGYLHDAGSGDGAFHNQYTGAQLGLDLSAGNPASMDSTSSSIGPSLITAKCWNNYQSDSDCKQLNLITSMGGNDLGASPSVGSNFGDNSESSSDDSLIRPIVIFESSSTLGPQEYSGPSQEGGDGGISSHLAPPYFSPAPSATPLPSELATLARHRTPPPPLTTPIWKPSSGGVDSSSSEGQVSSRGQQSPHRPAGNYEPSGPHRTRVHGLNVATTVRPTTEGSRSKNGPTSTLGRKCRDENDADCDEPDESEGLTEANIFGGIMQQSSKSSSNSKSGSHSDAIDEDDDDDEDDGDDSDDSEQGSGEPETGDTEDSDGEDDDDSDGDDRLGVSGSGDDSISPTDSLPEPSEPSSRFVEVTTSRLAVTPAPDSGASATIEVVEHSTLPPTFPSSTRGPAGARDESVPRGRPSSTPMPTTTSTTMMPDEVFTSLPIFPPSSQSSSRSPDDLSGSSSGPAGDLAGETTAAVATEDPYAFKPIPMPSVESTNPILPPGGNLSLTGSGGAVSGSDSLGGPAESSVIAAGGHQQRQHTQRPQALSNPWSNTRPVNPYQVGSANSESQAPIGGGQRGGYRGVPEVAGQPSQVRLAQQEPLLPTLLLYASILILSITALVFIITAFTFWRRNQLRHRSLMAHKQALLNGAAGVGGPFGGGVAGMNNPMLSGVQQPQQPGLLSTYAPAKGLLTLGSGGQPKVTTSLVKGPAAADLELNGAGSADGAPNEGDEDDDRFMSFDASADPTNALESQSKDLSGDAGSSSIDQQPQSGSTNRKLQARPGRQVADSNGWSNSDEQTTGSSDSQRTVEGAIQTNGGHSYSRQSTGRQASSSLSDSQTADSPDTIASAPVPSNGNAANSFQRQQPQPQQQQQPRIISGQHNPMLSGGACPSPYGIQQQQQQPLPVSYGPRANGVMSYAPVGFGPNKSVSRSVENMLQAGELYLGPVPPPDGRATPMGMPMAMQPVALVRHPHIQMGPPTQNRHAWLGGGQQPLPPAQPMGPLVRAPANYNLVMLANGGRPPGSVGLSAGLVQSPSLIDYALGTPVSPTRVAMNPLATLGRRYPPGSALNRNIFSEDSSSLVTASPSLARTSSSSSLAFNGTALAFPPAGPMGQVAPAIRAKPMVDPTSGRILNDYTQQASPSLTNGSITSATSGAPPVFTPRDRSEAWYV